MNIRKTQKGAVMIIMVLFLVVISSTILIGISYPISNQIKGTSEYLKSKESFDIADSQTENALFRFNKGKNDAPADIYLLGATATAELTEIGGDKSIIVKGSKNIFERYVKSIFTKGEGTSFNYGLQVGSGGLYMDGSSKVIGNVYANGDIVGIGGSQWSQQNEISGTAIAATLSNPIESISIYDNAASTNTFDIGINNNNQDIAQSFVAATTTSINEIQFYIKKIGTPANATVKIVNDDNGNPGSTVLTSGTLYSTLVTSSFAYVPTVMNSSVSLTAGNTYWAIIDINSSNNNNYYSLRTYNNLFSNFYTKQGRFVNNMTDLSPNTLDFDMRIFVGGDKGMVSGVKVGTSGTGDAWANTVTNSTVTGHLYCQSGAGNNKNCDTSRSDPVTAPYPISDANITEWKTWAETGGSTSTVNVDNSEVISLGPVRINGDLNISHSGKLYMTGPIYVTGTVNVTGSGKIFVDSSLDSASGLIISEGLINIAGSGGIYGSGQPGSYVVLNSLKSCTDYANCLNNPAIDVSGSAGSVVLNTPNGAIKLSGSAKIKAGSSKMLIMDGSTSVEYETGLTNINFTTGPSGSWVKRLWSEVLGL